MSARDLLVTHACIITGAGPVFDDGFIHIRNGRIASLGRGADAPRLPRAAVLDAGGRYVLPGFINPHMHCYGALARGMPVGRMSTFGKVLRDLWWRLDEKLMLDDVRVSALLCGIEAIRSGVTTLVDHHASYGAISGSLSRIAEATALLGLRASVCFEISDRAGKRARDEAVAESAHVLDEVRGRVRQSPDHPLRAMVGLHASMTLSDGTLDAARELMDIYGVGAHVHVAEGMEDLRATRRFNGTTPVARFLRAGILRPGTIAAHCVHVDRRDIELLRKSGATVVHNPLSNLNNAVGVAPVLALCARRIPVAIGTDGMSAGVAGDIRTAAFLHKVAARDAQAGGDEIRDAVWETVPELASGMFGFPIGVLAEGAAGDVVIVEARPPTAVTARNAWWHVLFGVLAAPVRTTVIAGSVRMRDFKLVGVDEVAVTAEARTLAASLWRRVR